MEIPKIQWYPGHIAKAEKKLSAVINRVDLIIEVRDARIPLSTGHPISINGLQTKNISLLSIKQT